MARSCVWVLTFLLIPLCIVWIFFSSSTTEASWRQQLDGQEDLVHRPLDWKGTILPLARRYALLQQGNNVSLDDELINNDSNNYQDESTLWSNVVVVITGGTSGIGASWTAQLLRLGAQVVVLGRNPVKLEALRQRYPNQQVETFVADLNDLVSVAAAGRAIRQRFAQIDILINNAGAHDKFDNLLGTHQTVQGYDSVFGVNYLSHVLLTELLAPSLQKSPRPVVLQISSSYHVGVDGSDLIPRSYPAQQQQQELLPPIASQVGGSRGMFVWRSSRSYSNSKLAQLWHAHALRRRWPHTRVVSACPGWVYTPLVADYWGLSYLAFPSDGWGLSSLWLALLDDNDSTHNDYYVNSDFFAQVMVVYDQWLSLPPFSSWSYAVGLRDAVTFVLAMSLLLFQRYSPNSRPMRSSPESYNTEGAEALHAWSLEALKDYL